MHLGYFWESQKEGEQYEGEHVMLLASFANSSAEQHIALRNEADEGKIFWTETKTKLLGLSPRANCTDQTTAACRRSWYQLLRIVVVTWSA
jgi:hypothetical protein